MIFFRLCYNLFKQIGENLGKQLYKIFDFCVSNPPYQKDVQKQNSSRRVSVDIFPDFQRLGYQISLHNTMIYPATWQKTLQKNLGKFLLQYNLYKCFNINSDNVFPDSMRWNYPLTIVVLKKKYDNKIFVDNFSVDRNIKYWVNNDDTVKILEKIKNIPKFSLGAKNLTNLSNIDDAEKFYGIKFFENSHILKNPIKIYIKKSPGKQPDGKDYFISYQDAEKIVLKKSYLNTYKVCIRSRVVGRLPVFNDVQKTVGNLQAKVFGPHYIAGKTWVLLKEFSNLEEAENFCRYVNTKFFMNLAKLDINSQTFASQCPDFDDYSNKNPIFSQNQTTQELNNFLNQKFV